jgi:RNA polymerase sigma factor (sigma-70 family)
MTDESRYLSELSRFPLLTASQEIQLGRQVKKYVELKDLPKDQLDGLQKRQIKAGLRAKEKLIKSNMKLAASIARKMLAKANPKTLTFSDLLQEGAIGLSRAVELFDPERGYKFSTYSYWWIRQSISRAIYGTDRMIRVPDSMLNRFIKAQRILKDFHFEHGHSPSTEQITELTGLQPGDFQLMAQSYHHKSSDDPLFFEGDQKVSIIDAFSDSNPRAGNFLESEVEVQEQVEKALFAVSELDDESRFILRDYFGLGGNEEKTLSQIAREKNSCREAVRLKRDRALLKIKKQMNIRY